MSDSNHLPLTLDEIEALLLEGVRALDRGEGRAMTDQDWQQLEDELQEHREASR